MSESAKATPPRDAEPTLVPRDAPRDVSPTDLETMVRAVVDTIGGGGETARSAAPGAEAFDLTSWVGISGAWDGVVIVRGTLPLGVRFAANMFDIPAGETQLDDITDAWGEFANTVGGWVKTLVAGPSILSLPRVIQGAANDGPPGAIAARLELQIDATPLVVDVIERGSSVRVVRRGG